MTNQTIVFIIVITILVIILLLLKASSHSDNPLDKGVVFERRDMNGDKVHLRITKKGKLIWCHAYREIKPWKFKPIMKRESELFDDRIETVELVSEINPSNKDEVFNQMLSRVVEYINQDLLKERHNKTVEEMFVNV